MAIGITYEEFKHFNPTKLELYEQGFKLNQKIKDEEMWTQGIYFLRAVSVAIDHCLHGREATSEYFKEPISYNNSEHGEEPERELTEEEKKQAREKVLMQLKIMMSNFNTSKKS